MARRTALLVILAGVGAPAVGAQTGGAPAPARLRVINLSPATPGLQVTVDGRAVAGDLGFGAGIAYVPLPAGRRHVRLSSGTGTTIVDATPTLAAGGDYTYSVQDLLGDRVAGVLAADDTAPVARRRARVRFGNALPNDLAVQATLRGAGAHFRATAPGTLSGYQDVPAGTYTLEIAASDGQVLLSVPGVTLGSGAISTLFSTGLNTVATATTAAQTGRLVVASGQGSQVIGLPLGTAPGAPACSVQVVNLVPPALVAGPLALAVDGAAALGALGFGAATARLPLAAGEHRIQVYRAAGGAPLIDTTVVLPRNDGALFVLHRLSGSGVGGTLAHTMPAPPAPARLRFGNASLQGQSLGAALGGGLTFAPIAVGGVTAYRDVPPGRYAVQVSAPDGTPLVTVPEVTVAAGHAYTVLAVAPGDAAHAAPLLAVSAAGSQFIAAPVAP